MDIFTLEDFYGSFVDVPESLANGQILKAFFDKRELTSSVMVSFDSFKSSEEILKFESSVAKECGFKKFEIKMESYFAQ